MTAAMTSKNKPSRTLPSATLPLGISSAPGPEAHTGARTVKARPSVTWPGQVTSWPVSAKMPSVTVEQPSLPQI